MKKTINVLFLGALLMLTAACATNQRLPQDFSGLTCTTPVYTVAPELAKVALSFEVQVPADYFTRHVTFTILPTIQFANGDREKLPCKSVQGRSVIETQYPVVDWSEDQVIQYKTEIPFDQALATALLDVDGYVYNCLTKAERIEDIAEFPVRLGLPLLGPPRPKPFVLPGTEEQPFINGKLYFPVNQFTVTKAVAAQPEISKTMEILKEFIQRDEFTISRIDIVGNASPEGMARINNPLAQKRANSTQKYVEKKLKEMGYQKDLGDVWKVTSTEGMGFWNEFYTAIKESDIPNKDQIADKFLGLHSDPKEAEKQIHKEMAGNPDVKNHMLPILRYGAVTVNYKPMAVDPEEAVEIAKSNISILSPAGIIVAAEHGNREEAISIYEQAIVRNPGVEELYINLANAYIRKGDFAAAEETLDKAGEIASNREAVDMAYAYMNIAKKDYAAAGKYLENLEGPRADYYRGLVALAQGRSEEAVELLKAKPDINLAIAQLNAGDVKAAKNTLEGLNQECPYVLYYTGVVYERMNDPATAGQYKDAALKACPDLVIDGIPR